MQPLKGFVAKLTRSLGRRLAARSQAKRIRHAPFYVRYPYREALPVAVCDARGAIDLERRFFFNRVPKCANSTVAVKLAELKLGRVMRAGAAKKAFARPSELSAEELAAFDGFFKFTFVRNPYSRALSAYLNKIVRGKKAGYLRAADSSEAAPSFLDFCRYLERGGLSENAHWAPQVSLMLLPIAEFDLIGRVESLNEDLRRVLERLAPGNALGSPDRHGPPPTNAETQLDLYYDAECAEIVERIYRRDFETFGYATGLPVA